MLLCIYVFLSVDIPYNCHIKAIAFFFFFFFKWNMSWFLCSSCFYAHPALWCIPDFIQYREWQSAKLTHRNGELLGVFWKKQLLKCPSNTPPSAAAYAEPVTPHPHRAEPGINRVCLLRFVHTGFGTFSMSC